MNEFGRLRDATVVRQWEWPGSELITPAFRGNELAGEVGEACNIVKKLERERLGINGSRAKISDLATELADIIICVDLLAMVYNIDLWSEVVDKFNASSTKLELKTRLVK